MLLNGYQKRLVCATLSAVAVVLVLYAVILASEEPTIAQTDENDQQQQVGALAATSSELQSLPLLSTTSITKENCPRMEPQASTAGKPVWVAGYPGSGFDFVAPLIAGFTGLTAVDVYQKHSCSIPISSSPTAGCISHWPMVSKDSPANVAVNGDIYSANAVFLLRNPAKAIPSYHTRWWGAQMYKPSHNREQPAEAEWKNWRNRRFAHHLLMWKRSLVEWQRGIPAAGVRGVSLYVPFEQLLDETTGPLLTTQMASVFAAAHHKISPNHVACLWYRIVEDEQVNKKKDYVPSFTALQRIDLLSTLDELIAQFSSTEPVLTDILRSYRADIETNLKLDDD